MKITICILFILVSSSRLLHSQERDSLIQLYPGMGDTLDLIDREIFDLYKDIDCFSYAQIFSRDKKFLISKISCVTDGSYTDSVIVEDISKYSDMRLKLNQFSMKNDKMLESPINAWVFTSEANKYEGKLNMFSKKFLYLSSNISYSTGEQMPFFFKASVEKIDSLMIPQEKNLLLYIGGGAFVGFLGGFFIGTATFEDDWGTNKEVKWMATGGIGALVGALLGWIIGESIPNDYITIRFNSPSDVTKLKDYSAYYFRYDKSVEDMYVESE